MILIRGIKGVEYAKKIEKGIVDCRDILSALLTPPKTGYEYSDYYEKNFAKALLYFTRNSSLDIREPYFLHSLLIDPIIPHIYLTYFHILNEKSLEWLEKFDNDHHFIAINVKLDRITKTAIGDEYFGARMTYVDDIRKLKQDINHPFRVACMCSMERFFKNKTDMSLPLQILNTLSFPLLCREENEKFTDIENEFRIIAYDCPRIHNGNIIQIPRNIKVIGKSGAVYQGDLCGEKDITLKSDIKIANNQYKSLQNILLEENGMITLNSVFKPIDISVISDDYRYIGDKNNCREYIKNMLKNIQPDIYVERTIEKTYKRTDLKKPRFLPGHHIVEY
ncbi:MAG: hypothetical protein IJ433_06240 [Ruminococcus sp.]|nr:hypothetical protein [Ruminococcus sp.]